MVHDGHLVLVTHIVPGADDIERKAAIFWRKPDGSWKAAGEAKGGLHALRGLVDAYRQRGIALEVELEKAKRAADYFAILMAVAPVLRAARHLHKTLQEARDAIKSDQDIIALRDLANDAERTCELVQQDAKHGLDYTTARRAEEQAETADHIAKSSHRLNLIAALFLPISALGSVFGVNLAHGLETKAAPWLFWGFVAMSFIFGFIVRTTISKKDESDASAK
ncbi:MAG: hypothetical protein JNK04_17575 [Myxococcales bacterium]|nr:hypothetical protein [Myxococcales bacterium]